MITKNLLNPSDLAEQESLHLPVEPSLLQEVMPVEAEDELSEILDPRVLSSVLISLKMARIQGDLTDSGADSQGRLLELMHSKPVRALLDTASLLSERQGMAPHEALQQIISTLQEIDALWEKELLKRGLDSLSSQYH
jgi:hypothetical protein